MYRCNTCGQTNTFLQTEYGAVDYCCIQHLDHNGDIVEADDYEYDDYRSNDWDDLTCGVCNSSNIDTNWNGVDDPEESEDDEPVKWVEVLKPRIRKKKKG